MILNHYFLKSKNKIFNKSDGNYLFDRKNQKYLDTSFGSGTLLFGHNDKLIRDNLLNQIELSILTNQNHDLAQKFDNYLIKFFENKRKYFVYCNSGTEASQRAIRYAREFNGKEKVLSFKGYWHGMNEWTLDGGGMAYTNVKKNIGIPEYIEGSKIQIDYNYENIKQILAKYHKYISCLILEPVPGSDPKKPNFDELNSIVEICRKFGVVTIFDEIISGFRCYGKGISFMLNDLPDIIIYGKSLGGGLPIGVVSLSEKIADKTFLKKNSQTLAGGTFSLNPLVSRSGITFLKKLKKHKFNEIELSNKFRNELNEYFELKNFDLVIQGYCSISRIIFTKKNFANKWERIKREKNSKTRTMFYKNIKNKKVIYPNNGLLFHSTIYQEKEFKLLKNTIINCLER